MENKVTKFGMGGGGGGAAEMNYDSNLIGRYRK